MLTGKKVLACIAAETGNLSVNERLSSCHSVDGLRDSDNKIDKPV